MDNKFCRVGIVAMIVFATHQSQAGSSLSLQVYCVSSEPKPGWRYFNSSAFPQLGYIATGPDMSISRIKSVSIQKTPDRSAIIHRDGSQEVHEEEVSRLVVEFVPDDARRFQELTKRHLNERVLWLLGNEELFAPIIRMPIEDSSVAISVRPGLNLENIKAQLEKLIE